MSQRLFKGRTNNHLTWVMVDSTDFATPESALSAATKIKIYGKLRGGTGVNFVSSGTGSLTNDIQHVGASALGIYTIALAKADLSDASAAWYDQYIVSLSATGAAYQMLVAEGVIDESALSGMVSDAHSAAAQANSRVLLVQSRLSDLDSRLVSDLSDIYSQVLLATSAASDAASAAVVGASRILLVQSRLSDFDSRLVSDISDVRSMLSDMMSDFQSRVPKRVATDSQLSDVHSDLKSAIGAITVALTASDISDIASAVAAAIGSDVSDIYSLLSSLNSEFLSRVTKAVATNSQLSDVHSDLRSQIGGITATLSASDISDIASAVWAHTVGTRVDSRILVVQSLASDAHSAAILGASHASDAHSAALLIQSRLSDFDSRLVSDISDVRSMLSDMQSDFQSRVPKRVATDSQLSDVLSDLRSLITAGVGVTSAAISDIASHVWAHTVGTRVDSRLLVALSAASDAASAAQQGNSRVLLVQSRLSDLDSRLASDLSDALSGVRSLRSAFLGHEGSTASQVADASVLEIDGIDHDDQFNGYYVKLLGGSQVDELRLIVDTDKASSKVIVKPAFLSRVASGIDFVIVAGDPVASRFQSDLLSRVSDVGSDLRSYLVGMSGMLSDTHSAAVVAQSGASDAASAAAQANSRILLVQSRLSDLDSRLASDVSDLYSLLSDLNSNFLSRIPKEPAARSQVSDLASDIVSDLKSFIGAGVPLDASSMSDIRSAIGNVSLTLTASDISDIASAVAAAVTTITASDISDIASRVDQVLASRLSDILSAAQQANSRVLVVQSQASDVYSLLSDVDSNLQSRIPKRVATDSQLSALVSDVLSALAAGVPVSASDMSDIRSAIAAGTLTASAISDIASAVAVELASNLSDIYSAAQQGNSRILVTQSMVSDVRSHVSDLQSDFQSRVPKLVATNSQVAAGVPLDASTMSDLRSAVAAATATLTASDISDIASAVRAALVSDLSDIYSAATQVNSRALVVQSQASDIYSLLSDLHSDVAVLSGVVSDVQSAMTAGVDLGASSLSDLRSAIAANGVLRVGAEPAAVPGHAATVADKVDWLHTLAANPIEQTAALQRVKNAADNDTIASAVVSDDGTTFIRDGFV